MTTAVLALHYQNEVLHPDGRVEKIIAGDHAWEYELSRPPQHEYTLDTPLETLVGDPAVWRAVSAVFGRHLPHVPIDGTTPGVSLNTVLGYFPETPAELVSDLVAAIGGGKHASH